MIDDLISLLKKIFGKKVNSNMNNPNNFKNLFHIGNNTINQGSNKDNLNN